MSVAHFGKTKKPMFPNIQHPSLRVVRTSTSVTSISGNFWESILVTLKLAPSNGREGNLFSSGPGFLGWYDWPKWSNHELLGYKCLEGSRKHTTGGPLPTSPRLHASSKLLHHLGVCWRWSRLQSVLRPQQVGGHNSNTKPGMKDLHATSSTCQELQGKYFEVSSACWVSLPASKGSNLETSCFSCFSSASFPDI